MKLAMKLADTVVLTILLASVSPLTVAAQVQEFRIDFRYAPSSSEPSSWTPKEGSVISGDWRIVVDVVSSSPLKSFDLRIVPKTAGIPNPGSSATVARSYPLNQNKTSDRIILQWDTDVITPFNATYRLVSSAVDWVDTPIQKQVIGIAVNNAPRKPSDPMASIENGSPQLTWTANTEPDIVGYSIYRAIGTQGFLEIDFVEHSQDSWSDLDAPKGVGLKYKLVTNRKSPVDESGINSVFSNESARVSVPLPKGAAKPERNLQNPLTQLGPSEASQIPAKPIKRGFAPLLPYSSDLALPFAAPQSIEDEINQQDYILNNASLSDRIDGQAMVNKPPFIAASLMLFVISLHGLRRARKLFRS